MPSTRFDADIILVGGGLVGLSFAIAAGQAGLSVLVLDAAPPAASLAPDFDGRVSALGRASTRLMGALGVWPRLTPYAQPILDIIVTDGRVGSGPSPLGLHFDHLDGNPDTSGQALGHIIENRHIRAALYNKISGIEQISIRAPAKVLAARSDGYGATVQLADGASVRGRLCVAADGRESVLRKVAGIKSVAWDYAQCGIVATVLHAQPHGGLAHEYFLPGGPFAILPITGNRSSLVWTEPTRRAQALMALDHADFDSELRARFGSQWGEVKSEGPRWMYPLAFHHAREYVTDRLALAGDAAHTIHPIAGQGLNLGLRDVAALAEVLVDAHRLGLDIGVATVLERYQTWRRFDNVSLAAVTDILNRLFSNDLPLLRMARDIGLGIAGQIGPLRRLAMRHAAGDVGTLPRLMTGEAL